jgi:uncharacterized protein YbjQ (UPF0145 family)
MRIRSIAIPLALVGCAPTPTTSIQSSSFATRDHQRLVVSPDHSCQPGCPSDHFCNVVEVVDLHTQATSEDKGFDELRARAAALGADAVMDAEFEHGEGNEPSHLSGTIVRGCETIRPYTIIGAIDVESDPNDADKGMGQLKQRRAAMGGDLVIGITFEHGDNGAKGHLRGQVIRYTR